MEKRKERKKKKVRQNCRIYLSLDYITEVRVPDSAQE